MQYTRLNWLNGEPYSEHYDDVYYSVQAADGEHAGHPGEGEFNHVFFSNNGLPERWQGRDCFTIAELGFGSGLNFILTVRHWLSHCETRSADQAPDAVLNYIAIEQHPLSPDDIRKVHQHYSQPDLQSGPELAEYTDELLSVYPPAIRTLHIRECFNRRVRVYFCFMPAYLALSDHQYRVDAWYLDGFSPAKNESMWTAELFAAMYENSNEGARFSTYTAAGQVRRNLQQAGFSVEKVAGYGRKRDMLRGSRIDEHAQTEPQQQPPGRSSAVHTSAGFHYRERPWYILPSRNPVTETQARETRTRQKHAVVIGAGIAGLASAWSLVQRGWRISLIDRCDGIAQQTSSNPAAIVYPRLTISDIAANEFSIVAFYHAITQLEKLQQAASNGRFWYQNGLLQCMKPGRLDSLVEGNGFEPETIRLDHENIALCNGRAEETAYLEDAGYVLPPQLCREIRQQCGDALEFLSADITAISNDNGAWSCYSRDQQLAQAPVVIIASNYDTGIQVTVNGVVDDAAPPIDRYDGSAIAFPFAKDGWPVNEVVNAGHYLVPPDSGQCYIGATYSEKNKPVQSTEADAASLLDDYAWLFDRYGMPAVDRESRQLVVWSGVRGMAPDRMPVIGPLPDLAFFRQHYRDIAKGDAIRRYPPAKYHDGLYYSLAHGSRGFTTSFLAGEILSAMISNAPLPVSATVMRALSSSRFLVNDMKRGLV